MAEERRLPPFPDELVDPRMKAAAIGFLQGLQLPPRIAVTALRRWGETVGVRLERNDYARVNPDLSFAPAE